METVERLAARHPDIALPVREDIDRGDRADPVVIVERHGRRAHRSGVLCVGDEEYAAGEGAAPDVAVAVEPDFGEENARHRRIADRLARRAPTRLPQLARAELIGEPEATFPVQRQPAQPYAVAGG